MSVLLQIAAVFGLVVLLVLWSYALCTQPKLALGMLIGFVFAAPAAALLGAITPDEIPVWLPPLPFAVVAICLFVFGALAWYWGRDDAVSR